MVKFSRGMWWVAPDVIVNWAVESIKSEVVPDTEQTKKIRSVATTKHVNHRGDTLNAPTITVECSSPIPDVIALKSTHWKGQQATNKGPHFELFPDSDVHELARTREDALKTTKTDTALKLTTSTISASIDTRPSSFSIDFTTKGSKPPTAVPSSIALSGQEHLLTRLGWRSIGYVKRGTASDHPNVMLENPDIGDRWSTLQFHLSVGERIYGLGERFGAFVKNGQSVDMWNEDGGTSSELTYKNVPFFLSSRGYGVFVACPGAVSFEVQSERTTRVNVSVPYESITVYIVYGATPGDIISRYTLITGRPALPPPWTFGLWLTTSFTTSYDENTVNKFLDGMRERDIPLEVFHFDCFWMKGFQWCDFEFDKEYFPDAQGQLSRLREKGYKICVWINPYIAQESALFDEAADNGYFIKKGDGSVWQYDYWQSGMAWVDFTNPTACEWYQSKLQDLLNLGVDCFKTDFGERIPTGNTVYYDGSVPEKMHNYYAFLYNKVVFQVLERHKGKNEATLFARSATSGGQRFPVHWGGDPMSTFEAMAETLRAGMSLGVCGFAYWAHDIGGFEGTPDPALYRRWIAFASLSSHTRLHGNGSYRVPWIVDPSGNSDKVLKHFVDLKLSLLPYFYLTAINSHKTGIPMMRPLFVEFPEDPAVWTLDTQFMMGTNLLVAPVFNAEGFVQYYVPEGKWVGLVDKKIRQGPGFFTETHDFMSLPVLLRPGSAIVMRESRGEVKKPVYDYTDKVTVLVNGSVDFTSEIAIPDSSSPGKIARTIKVTCKHTKIDIEGGNDNWKVDVV